MLWHKKLNFQFETFTHNEKYPSNASSSSNNTSFKQTSLNNYNTTIEASSVPLNTSQGTVSDADSKQVAFFLCIFEGYLKK